MFKSLSLKVIIFGFIFTFFSSFGQSFFLGLFNSSIRDTLSITHGQFGSIFASATLLSSVADAYIVPNCPWVIDNSFLILELNNPKKKLCPKLEKNVKINPNKITLKLKLLNIKNNDL